MRNYKLITTILFCSIFYLHSCKDASSNQNVDDASNVSTTPIAPSSAKAEPAQNELGVWHYTCALGCPGGAGSAVQCKNCKNVLRHNQSYHGSSSAAQSTPMLSPTASASAEPSQNTAGVWHYTCPKGCSGGAGSASKCLSCGETLAHNSAYH